MLLSLSLLTLLVAVVGNEEPTTPTCRSFAKSSLSFCSMVDYPAIVDADDADGAIADARAKFYYENVNVMLLRFGCHNKYSLYGCDDCRDAYKYWICSIKFQKCGNSGDAVTTQLCPLGSSTCSEGIDGRYRTCLSLCEDVVRKCPYVLNFQCPTVRFGHGLGLVKNLTSPTACLVYSPRQPSSRPISPRVTSLTAPKTRIDRIKRGRGPLPRRSD